LGTAWRCVSGRLMHGRAHESRRRNNPIDESGCRASRATPRANLASPEKACARNSAASASSSRSVSANPLPNSIPARDLAFKQWLSGRTRAPNSDIAERQTSGPFQAMVPLQFERARGRCSRCQLSPIYVRGNESAQLLKRPPRLLAGRRACRRWTKAILAAFAKANAGVAQPARSPSSGSSSVAARSTP
jgi:hypothetical protein